MYSEGMDESIIGVLIGFSAMVGICGSISYPFLRKCMGWNKTTYLGFIVTAICMFLCVISVFMPGSPFIINPFGGNSSVPAVNVTGQSGSRLGADPEPLSLKQLWEQHQHIFYFAFGIVFDRYGKYFIKRGKHA